MKGSIPAPPKPLSLKEYVDKCAIETSAKTTTLVELYESGKLPSDTYLAECAKVLAVFFNNIVTFKENTL